MAYKRSRYGRRKRRTYRRLKRFRRGRANSKMLTTFVSKGPGLIMPDRLFTTMRYSYHDANAGGASIFNDDIYYANSIYDCDAFVGTRNAQAFTWLGQFYSKFTVYGSKIQVTLANATGTDSIQLVIYPGSDTTTALDLDDARNEPRAKWSKYFAEIQNRTSCYLSHYCTSSAMFGLTNKELPSSSGSYSGSMGVAPSRPGQLWVWHVCYGDPVATTALTAHYTVDILYYVMLSDKVDAPA